MRKTVTRAALAAAGFLSAVSFASAAQATTTYTVTGWSLPFKVNGTIHAPTLTSAEAAQIGEIHFTTSDPHITLDVFCIDVDDILTTGTFTGYDVNTATDPDGTIVSLGYTPSEMADVGYLLSQFGASATNSVNSAALQLAIWEVLNETASQWNVTSGAFFATNLGAASAAVSSTANSYLTQLENAPSVGNYTMTILQPLNPGPGHNQTQVFGLVGLVPPPGNLIPGVPEPTTWGMIVLGFGLLGAALRRGRRSETLIA